MCRDPQAERRRRRAAPRERRGSTFHHFLSFNRGLASCCCRCPRALGRWCEVGQHATSKGWLSLPLLRRRSGFLDRSYWHCALVVFLVVLERALQHPTGMRPRPLTGWERLPAAVDVSRRNGQDTGRPPPCVRGRVCHGGVRGPWIAAAGHGLVGIRRPSLPLLPWASGWMVWVGTHEGCVRTHLPHRLVGEGKGARLARLAGPDWALAGQGLDVDEGDLHAGAAAGRDWIRAWSFGDEIGKGDGLLDVLIDWIYSRVAPCFLL